MGWLHRTARVLAFAIAIAPLAGAERAAEVSPLRALDRLAGTWDIAIDVKPGALVRTATTARGKTVNTWSDDRQTLRQVWSVTSVEGKLLFSGQSDLTYDPVRRIFRNKTQVVKGAASESEGTLDAETQAFTWKSYDPKLKTTTTSRSVAEGDGIEFWIMFIDDGAGRRIFECRGKSTRVP